MADSDERRIVANESWRMSSSDLGRILLPLALVATFVVGWGAAVIVRKASAPLEGTQAQEVSRLQQQVAMLQARLRGREDLAAARQGREAYGAGASGAPREERSFGNGRDRSPAFAGLMPAAPVERSVTAPAIASPSNVKTALERFYRYLETTSGPAEGRDRWRQARELVDDLKAMGPAAGQALMQVLATGSDTEERRAAARLLGQLQVPEALPLLRDVLDRESDVLLRRAAAQGLRQLQTPDSLPVMERLMSNAGEDRFVRLSAAQGLAEAGQPAGVMGLAKIFDEATSDGRGREMAFRAMASLKDDRPLPFMRQVVGAQVEPGYRLQAIRYVSTQGDQQALPMLQKVMQSPTEQPSIREAAAQAFSSLGGR